MRRLLPILLALLLPLFAFPALAEGENLLVNGSVDDVSASGFPTGWSQEVWFTDPSVSTLSVESDGVEGTCLCVHSASVNDARWAQTVNVEPNTIYRFSAMVRAEGIDAGGYGANLSISGLNVYSEMLYDTGGDWVELSITGRTGEDQTSVTVYARIGGYGDDNLNTGTAWFDDLSLMALSDAEAGDVVYNFYADTAQSDWGEAAAEDEAEPERYTETLLLGMFGYVLAVIAFARKARSPLEMKRNSVALWAGGILLLALIVRLIVAAKIRGYNTDIACFEAWSERMASVGPVNFYAEDYFCDYPPGYMLLLAPIAFLRNLLGIAYDSTAHVVLIKLLPIFCDLLGAAIVFRFCQKRLGDRAALLLCAFYAFNPAVLVDSAAWGQIDSVLTLLLVICAMRMVDGHYISSLCAFAAAILVKPQALLFAPIGLAALCLRVYSRLKDPFAGAAARREARRAIIGVVAAFAILYLFSLPFCLHEIDSALSAITTPFAWLWEKLFGATQGYRYMTVNTLNLYAILGLNWVSVDAAGAWQYIAWTLFGLSYVYALCMQLLSRDAKKVFLTGGTLIVLLCAFGPMMHERYVYPAIILLVLAYAQCRDRRILLSALVLTVTLFMNETLVLQGGMTELNYGHLSASEEWLNTSLSIVNVLNALFLAWTALEVCVHGRVQRLSPALPRPEAEPEKSYRLGLRRVDAALMAAVTLVYGVFAFINLGDTDAPQSEWISSAPGEEVVFDLGAERDFIMTYYGGICDTAFTVSFSNDGEVWTEPVAASYDQGQIFRWLWLDQSGATRHARYVRLSADDAGLRLREVGFLDENGEPLPIASTTSQAVGYPALVLYDPGLLTDEQETVPAYPSYLNSTYFDEIYHARTAYEQVHYDEFDSAYEWTHPPLGKTLMMIGIELFGMTPFGWRFMGTLMGVLMLPVMYLLVKQVTKRTDLSLIAMFLLAVDSMHFTQTRIATIDSYAVLFIMVMYLFMFRYSQMRWRRDGFARSLIPLGLCGLFMGIAWATKWIGIYGSVGLVVIFFWTLWKNFRDERRLGAKLCAKGASVIAFVCLWLGMLLCLLACAAIVLDVSGLLALSTSLAGRAMRLLAQAWIPLAAVGLGVAAASMAALCKLEPKDGFLRRLGVLSLFCVGAFIVIPLLIYYFSYYWQLRVSGDFSISRVVNLQKSIFNYHAGLGGDTHAFRSDWYQWPVIAWPMWYYSGTSYLPEGMISSISCMGNPAVFWFGLVAIVLVAVRSAWERRASRSFLLVLIAFLSQYLPWVLVPRSTFIYHYFASVPFIIMASVLVLDRVRVRNRRAFVAGAGVLCALALVLFIAFYPLESGLPVSRAYASLLRWFNWVNF